MAAEALGHCGRGVGIDMTVRMIELANEASGHVNKKLGFNNDCKHFCRNFHRTKSLYALCIFFFSALIMLRASVSHIAD